MDGTAVLGGARRGILDHDPARRAAPRCRRAGYPCQLLRGGCLCHLGKAPPADRGHAGGLGPKPAPAATGELRQMFGDCWEWTRSAFMPYPRFRPVEGALGEYNGKFMSGQFVLRGGSCVTPEDHVRA